MEEIIAEMGTPREFVEGFGENLTDADDYETLQSMATDRMKSYLTADVMADAKKHIQVGERMWTICTYYVIIQNAVLSSFTMWKE